MIKLRYPLTVAALAAVAVAVVSCDSANKSDNDPASTPKTTNASARQELKEAVVAARESLGESKDQFLAEAEMKLKQFDVKLTELSVKASVLATDAKSESTQAVEALKNQRAKLGSKLEEVRQAGQENWRQMKAGFEAAWQDIEKGYDTLKLKVSG